MINGHEFVETVRDALPQKTHLARVAKYFIRVGSCDFVDRLKVPIKAIHEEHQVAALAVLYTRFEWDDSVF